MVLDVDRLAAEENQDWLLNWTQTLPGRPPRRSWACRVAAAMPSRCANSTSTPRPSSTGGFVLPEAKGGVDWLDADTLLLSSAFGEGMATTSGYARTVRRWRRGEPVERRR